jgi:hypothetical protein
MSNYEKVKEWRKNNPDKVLEQARRYRKKHPETNKKAKAKYRETNIEKIRESDRIAQARRRKADPEGQKIRYERWRNKKEAELWDIAGRPRAERCELCMESVMTVFDHCHDGGHFRGWICDRCNRVLGSVKDDTELLKAMIRYLENDRGKTNSKEKK